MARNDRKLAVTLIAARLWLAGAIILLAVLAARLCSNIHDLPSVAADYEATYPNL
jgi:hypothetical protein